MNSKNKKCCLNCAFCERYKVYCSRFSKTTTHNSLTTEERGMISNNDFGFLGEEERKYNEYREEYEKHIVTESSRPYNVSEHVTIEAFDNFKSGFDEDKAKKWGMDTPPDGYPETDILYCYQSQFSDKEKEVLKQKDKPTIEFLQKKQCEYFYPYKGCEGLPFEGIEKKQVRQFELENAIMAKNALKISKVGLLISIIVLIVSAVGAVLGTFDFFGDKKWQERQISGLGKIKDSLNTRVSEVEGKIDQLNDDVSKFRSFAKEDFFNVSKSVRDTLNKQLESEAQQNIILQDIKGSVDKLGVDNKENVPKKVMEDGETVSDIENN